MKMSPAIEPKISSTEKTPDKFGAIVELLLSEAHLSRVQLDYAQRVKQKLRRPRTLLSVLQELKFVSEDQIKTVVRRHIGSIRIGDLLVELGVITADNLQSALRAQRSTGKKKKLGEILIQHHLIDERKLVETLSIQLGFPFVEPEFGEIDPALFGRAGSKVYLENCFVPMRRKGDQILVAFSDPLDRQCMDLAQNIWGSHILPAIATRKSILETIRKMNPGSRAKIQIDDSPAGAVELVDRILTAAIEKERVSDIHIEPMKDRLRVRFRLDGVLVQYKDFPPHVIPALTSRIKILCEADIAERRRHQGGRILYPYNGDAVDLRASFFVTVHGEKIVLRVLNRQSELLEISAIGMAPRMLERFRLEALESPSGVLIVTGPTGSGKTTTVYSCINYLNTPETSIITAEEPVEYVIEGIAQCAINPKIDLTFNETLRHMVRQDPDVIVIGEIRDQYSAEVAVQAALTGHKVVTTFHTEDSIGGLIRLLNMDIDAFLISSTVVCILAQRLLRKVCPTCSRHYHPAPEDYLRMGCDPKDLEGARFRFASGCPECMHTGYQGRIAVFEMLILNESVRDSLIERRTSHQIRKVSIASTGLVTLFEDGLVKAARGITSIEEVLRCLPRLQKPRPLPELRRLLGV